MRNNSQDSTLERNYLEKYRFLIKEYEQVKNKTHPVHKKAMDFYKANDTCRKSFLKYYKKIIKERMGQLGHIDCHHLSKSIIRGENRRLYLVCIIDDYSRIAWAELIPDITSLTVMFAALKCLNILSDHYEIKFEEILSDNGPEFGIKTSQQKYNHPFERMLIELGIVHRHTKPYRPQTNGKVERFWRTLEDDLIRETDFDSLEELKEELLQYLYYYNHERPHQGIDGKKPIEMINLLPK
ncbi:integrase core domain-containing protein [Flavobacterium anhuiense]|uniref:integrase core domain-containing protein n=2 Tax=Flavobacterium anhuiense TaxID=459526 RepID=UPI000E6C1AF5|nr:integrase core domain-containing protein [Flavobacterium anhuiense]